VGYSSIATWTAVANGTSGTATSTKITFTFNSAVTGLTANDITITNGTGKATKSSISGSGTTWDLTITSVTEGTVSVRITKGGVNSDAQSVNVYENPLPDASTTQKLEITGIDSKYNGKYVLVAIASNDENLEGGNYTAAGMKALSGTTITLPQVSSESFTVPCYTTDADEWTTGGEESVALIFTTSSTYTKGSALPTGDTYAGQITFSGGTATTSETLTDNFIKQ
jgi:hypothetical protein